jgi:hypothetical protein
VFWARPGSFLEELLPLGWKFTDTPLLLPGEFSSTPVLGARFVQMSISSGIKLTYKLKGKSFFRVNINLALV